MTDHLDSDLVAAYAEQRLGLEERSQVEAHAADCAECRRVLTHVSVELAGLQRRRRLLLAAPMAVAAGVALVLMGVGRTGPHQVDDDQLRPSAGAGDARFTLAIHAPAAGGAVPRGSLRFAWSGDGPDALYELTVADSAGMAVWNIRTGDTVQAVPDSVVLVPGVRYLWWVDALRSDGRVASTGNHEFMVLP
jgi:hypothetical protein